MRSEFLPLVSIVVPVYNNAEYLSECLDSILAQTYQNWDCTIVNNCSTDGSGEIARRYAAMDSRIRVRDNDQFMRVVANHNNALRQITPESKYCKIVFADDWIFPRCIEEMVVLAEKHPSVGIVGAYGLEENRIAWTGLPYKTPVISGRDICRRLFLEGLYVFGTSNSVLYRSDLVRAYDPFYNESNFHADMEAAVVLLKSSDFGFVHQILTFKRLGEGSLTLTVGWDLMTYYGCMLNMTVAHGPDFMNDEEFQTGLGRQLTTYYKFLAASAIRGRWEKKFWEFHKRKLNESVGFSRARLARAILFRTCRMILNPYETFGKIWKQEPRTPLQREASGSAPEQPFLTSSQSAGH